MLYMNMFASDFRIVNSRQILYVYIRSIIEQSSTLACLFLLSEACL